MNNIFINLNSFKKSIYIEQKDIFLMNLYQRKKNINLIIKRNKSFSYNNKLPSLIINNKSKFKNNNNKIYNNNKIKIKNDISINSNKKNFVINKKNISRNIYLNNSYNFLSNNKDIKNNKKNIDNDCEKCLKIFNISSFNILHNKNIKNKNKGYNSFKFQNEMATQTNLYYKINIKNNRKKNNIINNESREDINKSYNNYIYQSIYYKSK